MAIQFNAGNCVYFRHNCPNLYKTTWRRGCLQLAKTFNPLQLHSCLNHACLFRIFQSDKQLCIVIARFQFIWTHKLNHIWTVIYNPIISNKYLALCCWALVVPLVHAFQAVLLFFFSFELVWYEELYQSRRIAPGRERINKSASGVQPPHETVSTSSDQNRPVLSWQIT
jgi:hypothetical protein